jgi:hypothetical protein
MRSKRDIYAIIAALLPVALGFGLIDLYVSGRIGAMAAILSVLALAAVMFVVAVVADLESEARPGSKRDRLSKDRE